MKIIYLTLLLCFCLNAKTGPTSSFYDDLFVGEHALSDYYGPLYPGEKNDYLFLKRDSLDDLFDAYYSDLYLFSSIAGFAHHNLALISEGYFCPRRDLHIHYKYFRYLFRLISISYLFEGLKSTSIWAKNLGLDISQCHSKAAVVLKRCGPKSKDMSLFLSRAKGIREQKVKLKKVNPQKVKLALSTLNQKTRTSDLVLSHLKGICQSSCSLKDTVDLKNLIVRSCLLINEQIKSLCSETDHYFGLSQLPLVGKLIIDSHALEAFDDYSKASHCLKQYVKVFEKKEEYPPFVAPLFSLLHQSITNAKKQRYSQGELFLPGSLKKFDLKGLKDFLYKRLKAKLAPRPLKEKPEKKEVTKPKKLVPKQKVAIKKPAKTSKKSIKSQLEPLRSPFEQAVAKINSGAKEAKVDMAKMRFYFSFNEVGSDLFIDTLKEFQTRRALIELKKIDHFGSKKLPVPLMFLWFLVDQNQHQGLFNIVSVLGSEFYVFNDLENKDRPFKLRLALVGNAWQFTLIRQERFNRR